MKKTIIILFVQALVCATSFAQTLQTSFFLDNNAYSYRINPAIASERGFVGIGINNIDLSGGSMLGAGNFLFKGDNGKLTTGLNSSVSSEAFLGKLSKSNNLTFEENISLLAFGFWTKSGWFNNFEVNVRGYEGVTVPKDLFAFLKDGSKAEPYDLSALSANAQLFTEIAYGLNKSLMDGKLSVGGRVKVLAGLANAGLDNRTTNLTVNGEQIAWDVDMYFRGAASILSIPSTASQSNPSRRVLDISNMEFSAQQIAPAGFGAAVDLGATFKPIEDLTLSLSVVDLGAISWKYNAVGHAYGKGSFTGVEIADFKNIADNFEGTIEDLKSLVEFEAEGGASGAYEAGLLPVTINAGARYSMPFYKRLSVGVLGSYCANKMYGYWDVRGGATVTPVNWFSLTANYGVSSYGGTFGTAMSLNLANINIFTTVEGFSGKYGDIGFGIPVPLGKFRLACNFGVNIVFGKVHSRY